MALAVAVAVSGCGAAAPRKPSPPVRLQLKAPADGSQTLAASVPITGTVSPANATVLVSGRQVAVTGGAFTATVPITPGFNVVDVIASAPRSVGAADAVRVYRQALVTVPDLGGDSPGQATARLRGLGLVAQVHQGGGFLQSLIPFLSAHVCHTTPAFGRAVAPRSLVAVEVAKLC